MRIRVEVDVRKPLFRRKKLNLQNGITTYATFKYERLPIFSHLCDKLGHYENFCKLLIHPGTEEIKPTWDETLQAIPWLKDENGGILPNSEA